MTCKITFNVALLAAGVIAPNLAHAASVPATSTGTATAALIDPAGITAVNSLRFGQFVKPVLAGTITVDVSGAVTPTGGVVGLTTIAQTGGGVGPATFVVRGDPNRNLNLSFPSQTTITAGAATMRVSNFTHTGNNGNAWIDATGTYNLAVGGRLNIAANQAVGKYTGVFTVTVTYQ